jgi:N-acetylmuramoyl-L-alanine amidase
MATKNIYLSPSNQESNVGVGGYNEEAEMHKLAELIAVELKLSPMFNVRMSNPKWTLQEVTNDSNNWGADLHICLHTDAGPSSAGGTTAFIMAQGGEGEKFAKLLYPKVANLSPRGDRGINVRSELYELRKTKAPAVLIENFFHTNVEEVSHYRAHMSDYAKVIAQAIYEMYQVPYPQQPAMGLNDAIDYLSTKPINGGYIINNPSLQKSAFIMGKLDPKYVESIIVRCAKYIKANCK